MCAIVQDIITLNIKLIEYYLFYHKNSGLILAHTRDDGFTKLCTAAVFIKTNFRRLT